MISLSTMKQKIVFKIPVYLVTTSLKEQLYLLLSTHIFALMVAAASVWNSLQIQKWIWRLLVQWYTIYLLYWNTTE